MYLFVPIVIITGLAMFFPEILPVKGLAGYSGILINALLHIVMGFAITIFLCIHLYMCTMGAKITSSFKSILTGWHG
jgi:thiosulfate reductase cytochrome b subunit